MNSKLMSLTVAALVLALGMGQAFGQTSRDKARDVFNKNKDSVVWITASVKVEASGGGRSLGTQEAKTQAIGTIIDPSGLTVVALSVIDPAINLQGRTVNVGQENVRISAKSEFPEVKIVQADGTEVLAKIVLTDEMLDLAFVRPEKEMKVASFAKIDKKPELKILDEIVCLFRMPKSLDQAPVVSLSEVSGIVTKPRTFYIGGRTLGGPVYTLDGDLAGITVSYKTEAGGNPQVSMVILPTEDIAKGAKEAMAKKIEVTTQESTTKETPADVTPASAPKAEPKKISPKDEPKATPAVRE